MRRRIKLACLLLAAALPSRGVTLVDDPTDFICPDVVEVPGSTGRLIAGGAILGTVLVLLGGKKAFNVVDGLKYKAVIDAARESNLFLPMAAFDMSEEEFVASAMRAKIPGLNEDQLSSIRAQLLSGGRRDGVVQIFDRSKNGSSFYHFYVRDNEVVCCFQCEKSVDIRRLTWSEYRELINGDPGLRLEMTVIESESDPFALRADPDEGIPSPPTGGQPPENLILQTPPTKNASVMETHFEEAMDAAPENGITTEEMRGYLLRMSENGISEGVVRSHTDSRLVLLRMEDGGKVSFTELSEEQASFFNTVNPQAILSPKTGGVDVLNELDMEAFRLGIPMEPCELKALERYMRLGKARVLDPSKPEFPMSLAFFELNGGGGYFVADRTGGHIHIARTTRLLYENAMKEFVIDLYAH